MLLVGTKNGELALINLASKAMIHEHHPNQAINRVKFTSDGKKLFAAIGQSLNEISGEILGMTIQSYEGHTDDIVDFCLDLGQPQPRVYTCSNHSIRLWDLRSPNPYHTFIPETQSTCIDYLPTENVLLTGDTTGCLKSWNLRTMTVECSHVPSAKDPWGITTIAVSPDNNWICVGSKGTCVYEYKYKNKQYVLQSVVPGREDEWYAVAQCTFPQATAGPAVVAFDEFIGQYDPSEYKPNDTDITWTKEISSGIEGSKISCCTVDPYSTVFFSGHTSGHVISYTLDSDRMRTLPMTYDGEINSLDFLGAQLD